MYGFSRLRTEDEYLSTISVLSVDVESVSSSESASVMIASVDDDDLLDTGDVDGELLELVETVFLLPPPVKFSLT